MEIRNTKKTFLIFGDLPFATKIAQDLLDRKDVDLLGVVCDVDYVDKKIDPWPDVPLNRFAVINSIPVYKLSEIPNLFNESSIDIGFTCRFSKIIKKNVISCFRDGIINFHGGLLPEKGGVNTVCHSILEADTYAGGTIHYIDENIDSGDIIDRLKFIVNKDETAFDIYKRTQESLYSLYKKNIENIINDEIKPISQRTYIKNGHKKRYYSKKDLLSHKPIKLDKSTYSEIKTKALAFDFPYHEPAFIQNADDDLKIYVIKNKPSKNTNLDFLPTRLFILNNSSKIFNNNLWVKDDSFFPFYGGGNKARKVHSIKNYLLKKKYNSVVTNGGINSNHVRATALMCAENNIDCHIIYHKSNYQKVEKSTNLALTKLSGADISFTTKDKLSQAMDDKVKELKLKNNNPYYLWGGSHNRVGVESYIQAVMELKDQCDSINWQPDYIFLPSGTGSTQLGIEIGLRKIKWKTKLIGISIAREKQHGLRLINNLLYNLADDFDFDLKSIDIDFRDEWIGGGYEIHNEEVSSIIKKMFQNFGLMLDPTYSGKGFYGMLDILKKEKIKNSNILFWHTGGLNNLIGSSAFEL